MDAVNLVVLVCMECSGIYAVQAEWLSELDEDEVSGCYYCGSSHTGTLVFNAMEVS